MKDQRCGMMKASVFTGPRENSIVKRPMPSVGMDEVLIRVRICGVCASELGSWMNGDGGPSGIRGHEAVGSVESVGKRVHEYKRGDRVTGLFYSSFAEYAVAKAENIVHVPDNIADDEALGEPLACLVSGADRTVVQLGDTAAVIGVGYMGLGMMQLLAIKGASRIIAVDTRTESLCAALRFGAHEAYAPRDVPAKYKVTDWPQIGLGVNIVAEATGKEPGLQLAGDMTAVHGTLSIVGWHQDGIRSVDMGLWNWKAINIINAHERRDDVLIRAMRAGLALISAQRLNMKDMVTHRFGLGEVDLAFTALLTKPEGFIKAVVDIDKR